MNTPTRSVALPAEASGPSPTTGSTPSPTTSSTTSPTGLTSWRDLRLRKHADYQSVYRSTRKQFSASMTWFLVTRPASEACPDRSKPVNAEQIAGLRHAGLLHAGPRLAGPEIAGPRIGLTVGKVIGKAHERNRIKRRMREIIRQHWHELPSGVDLILHPRRSVMSMDFVKLNAEVLRIFRQAKAQSASPARTSARIAHSEALSPPTVS